MKTIGIIPARLASTRLPGKVLLDIHGKPMIEHVYAAASRAHSLDAVYIATDSREVSNACHRFTDRVILTDPRHESGTDRVAEASMQIDADVIINIQGDEPMIDPALIDALAQRMAEGDAPMASAMRRITRVDRLQSPDVVKVVVDHRRRALYFSRSIIPHHRDGWQALLSRHELIPSSLHFYRHIGLYAYRRDFLQHITSLEPTYLERIEKLEQLRVLEHGFPIEMIETDYDPIGVDTAEDLAQVQELMR